LPDPSGTKLILIGSSRNDEDAKRVETLKQLTATLKITQYVEFRLNVSYDELKDWLSKALIGYHTMWNEHFGIGIVEYMAAGVIPIAHNSGGPKADIIDHGKSGFLAKNEQEYAEFSALIFHNTSEDNAKLQKAARAKVEKFSDEAFTENFTRCISKLIPQTKQKQS